MTREGDSPGAVFRFDADDWSGKRDEKLAEEALRTALVAHESGGDVTLKDDERSLVTVCRAGDRDVIVKEVRKSGIRRRLADVVRGAPARRAFGAGRRLLESGVGAALPLAAVERRRFGLPARSLLVSRDLRADPTAAALLAEGDDLRGPTLELLADLLLALHAAGAVHGDLRAQHVHVRLAAARPCEARLIDLESVRFRAHRDDAGRLDDWAQIAGSIPDADATREARRTAFERYADVMPFSQGAAPAFEELMRRSVARRHLYRGDRSIRGGGAPT